MVAEEGVSQPYYGFLAKLQFYSGTIYQFSSIIKASFNHIRTRINIPGGLAVMLKGIPPILSPELLKILMEMGHGDELIISDGNFPAASIAQRLVRCDGHGVPEILDAVLKFFPLDSFVAAPAALMQVVPGHTVETPIWDTYKSIINKYEPVNNKVENIERFAFYERAKKAYAVIATGEKALYANIILKKGVVVE